MATRRRIRVHAYSTTANVADARKHRVVNVDE